MQPNSVRMCDMARTRVELSINNPLANGVRCGGIGRGSPLSLSSTTQLSFAAQLDLRRGFTVLFKGNDNGYTSTTAATVDARDHNAKYELQKAMGTLFWRSTRTDQAGSPEACAG